MRRFLLVVSIWFAVLPGFAFAGITPGVVDTVARTALSGSANDTTARTALSGAARVLNASIPTTSGTSITLSTSVPSWAKEITIALANVGTTGTSEKYLQIGSGGIQTTSYGGTSGISSGQYAYNAIGFGIYSISAADRIHGYITLRLMDAATNTWVASGVMSLSNVTAVIWSSGGVSLAGPLTHIALTTANGTDAFASGKVSVSWQ